MELIVISPTRLKIMLTEPDMRRYQISADTADCANGRTRQSLRRLFDDARRETGFETNGARLLIQLYASVSGGCEIFVTKLGDQDPDADALTPPEEALLRRVFGDPPKPMPTARKTRPEEGGMPVEHVSSAHEETIAEVSAVPTTTATRPAAILLPDTETLVSVCHRLLGIGYKQDSCAYELENGDYCLLLQVPDTTFYRLPLAYAFLNEYGRETDAAHLAEYLAEHGIPLCERRAVSTLGRLH